MTVYEKKFPVIQYSHVPPPFIYCHKLWWTNSGATSGFVCCFQTIMAVTGTSFVVLTSHRG